MRDIKKLLVMVFCLWHGSAIALYLMPNVQVPVLGTVIGEVKAAQKPYVLLLSQWQWWNIFSPDPLRRSSVYRIDIHRQGKWQPVQWIDYGSLRWSQRAKEIKILERLEENWKTLVPSYLQQVCAKTPQSGSSTIRLVAVSVILPSQMDQLATLSARHLPTTERVLGSVLCSHTIGVIAPSLPPQAERPSGGDVRGEKRLKFRDDQ